MSANNPVTSAWLSLAALCLPLEELKKKHGVAFHCSSDQSEMRLTAGDCTIVVTRKRNEITAVMHEPNGGILVRTFSVEGGIDYPVLIEDDGSNPKRVSEVFEELMAWVRALQCSPS